MTPLGAIDQAFLQLEFAIKLLCYVELGKISKEAFDTDLMVRLHTRNLNFPGNRFDSYDDLILGSQNNYQITLGFTTITLDRALEGAGATRQVSDSSNLSEIRALVYMLRCAFAHDMMHPRWEAKGPYARVLRVQLPSRELCLDLQQLNGQPFDDTQIGGIESYFEIKEKIRTFVAAQQQHASDGAARRS